MKVYIHNVDPEADTRHWRNEHTIVRELARHSRCHTVVDDPADAALILLCGSLTNTHVPWLDIWRHPVYKAYRGRCVRIGTEDNAFVWWPGLYASLPYHFSGPCFKGGPYPHVALMESIPDNPPVEAPSGAPDGRPYLYSFVGAFDTASMRSRLGAIRDDRAFIDDTSAHRGRGYGQPNSVYADYRHHYAQSLKSSLFVLCPRGKGPSSIRIFEAMRAARVPVIISDDWTPPDGPDWGRFSLRIPEAAIADLPQVLREAESRGIAMRDEAYRAWKQCFARESQFDHIVDTASACRLKASHGPILNMRLRCVFNVLFRRGSAVWFVSSIGRGLRKEQVLCCARLPRQACP